MQLYLNDILYVLDRAHPSPVMPVVTISMEPVTPDLLGRDVSVMISTWSKITRRKDFKSAISGWYRGLYFRVADSGKYGVSVWIILAMRDFDGVVPMKPSRESLDNLARVFAKSGNLETLPEVDGWCCTGHGNTLVNNVRSRTECYPLIQDVMRAIGYRDSDLISDAVHNRKLQDSGGSFREVTRALRDMSPW